MVKEMIDVIDFVFLLLFLYWFSDNCFNDNFLNLRCFVNLVECNFMVILCIVDVVCVLMLFGSGFSFWVWF